MDKRTYYKNNATGEITYSHDVATKWHQDGAEIGVYYWSNFFGDMVEKMTWVH